MSRLTYSARRAGRGRLRQACRLLGFFIVLAVGCPFLADGVRSGDAVASSSFNFNWAGTPATPQPWVPGQVNDWDLLTNIDGPVDTSGAMAASHGPDCGPPPATHNVVNLVDSAFICKNHMMTAVFGGGDAFVSYGAVYFTPAQMLDWSHGQASASWKVSTERASMRDWWTVNLTPFAQNLVLPLQDDLPAYQGEPPTGLQLQLDNGTCGNGNVGSILRVSTISNNTLNEVTQNYPCVEDQVLPSAQTRSQFQIDVSANHLKVSMPGTNAIWYDGPVSLPFNQAVVQFSHHSYNPTKGGAGAPGTFHWSDVSISPNAPFTMLRPQQPHSLHDGQNPALTLPQPSPQNGFLRFAGLGDFQVSFDGGRSFQPARVQGSNQYFDHFASYWTPMPAGTTQIVIRGRPNSSNFSWWVEDVSVWAAGASGVQPPGGMPTPTPTAIPTPTPTQSPPQSVPPLNGEITFRSASTAGNSRRVSRAPHVAKGDLLLAALEVDAEPAKVIAPAGWKRLNDTTVAAGTEEAFHGLLYYKIAGSHEPPSYRFRTPPGAWTNVQVLDYTGVDPSHPIDAVGGRDAGKTSTPSSPPLTTTSADGVLVLFFMNYEAGTWTPPSGMTKRTEIESDSVMDQPLGIAGPTDTRTAQTSAGGPNAALAVALRPA